MISLGTTCYLALPNVQELTPGNCLIIPINHVTSTLECDDDVWTEIRVSFQVFLVFPLLTNFLSLELSKMSNENVS